MSVVWVGANLIGLTLINPTSVDKVFEIHHCTLVFEFLAFTLYFTIRKFSLLYWLCPNAFLLVFREKMPGNIRPSSTFVLHVKHMKHLAVLFTAFFNVMSSSRTRFELQEAFLKANNKFKKYGCAWSLHVSIYSGWRVLDSVLIIYLV